MPVSLTTLPIYDQYLSTYRGSDDNHGSRNYKNSKRSLRHATHNATELKDIYSAIQWKNRFAPLYLIANGMKIGIVSATQIERNAVPDTKEATSANAGVLRCMDPSALLEVIAETKADCDFVILYIHWGTESQEETDWLQDKQAPIYAQAGVDLIIGDHPHCLQKLDAVSGVPVVYSLGNYWFNSKTQDTCLVEVGINKDGIQDFRFIACRQEDCRTRELEGTDRDGVLNYMRGLSPKVQIDSEGFVTFHEE